MRQQNWSSASGNWRRLVWFGLLISASVAFSLGLACATPFAAFGAAAALTLSRRDALVLVHRYGLRTSWSASPCSIIRGRQTRLHGE
jgi:hypothetical protein